ncbi:unnamed protein product, partial [Symbiodinium microadriaticum]
MTKKLQSHARRFHRAGHQRRMLLEAMERAKSDLARRRARIWAAHVAAWLVYAPRGYVPGITEMDLLRRFLSKVGDGRHLSTSQQRILRKVQSVLERATAADPAWEQMHRKLVQKLDRFRQCDAEHLTAPVTKDVDVAEAESNQMLKSKSFRKCSLKPSKPSSIDSEAGHEVGDSRQTPRQLFNKMNEWTNMVNEERLACIEKLELARKNGRMANQAKLAEVLYTVAAALSPPRKSAHKESSENEAASCADAPIGEASVNLQHRARSLLLQLLRDWKKMSFDCGEIHTLLDHINRQLSRFEAKVGDLRLAAAGLSWLAIQRAIADLQELSATQGGKMLRSGPKEQCRGAKEAVMKAMEALGGTAATSKQVKDYLEEHPELFPTMSAAERQRSIRGLRLWQICELHGKNQHGEDVFAIPSEAVPTGVRRHKDYFTARTKLECFNTICIGPSRATAHRAKRDYEKMR